MTKFSNKLKKTLFLAHFGSIFPILEVKNIFLENPAQSHTALYGILAPCQILEKTNDTTPRKPLDRRMDGGTERWKDGRMDRPYFIGPFRLLPEVQYSVRKQTKTFQSGAGEDNALVDPLLFFSIYRFKYEIYQLKYNTFL